MLNIKYEKSYEIDKLIDRRIRKFEHVLIIQYLIR